jgi:hypothetical protein
LWRLQGLIAAADGWNGNEADQPLGLAVEPRQRRGAEGKTNAGRTVTAGREKTPRNFAASINWWLVVIVPHLHRFQFRWLSPTVAQEVPRDCQKPPAHSLTHPGAYKQLFSPKTPNYSDAGAAHALRTLGQSSPTPIFDEFPSDPFLKTSGNRRELKASTQFLARKREKIAPTLSFQKRTHASDFRLTAQIIDSTG